MIGSSGIKSRLQECCFIFIPSKGRRAIWELTHFCPHKCPYCFTSSSEELKMNRELLENQRKRFIRFLTDMEVTDVLLTGGEPFSLSDCLIRTIKSLGEHSMSYSISTSGYPLKLLQEISSFKEPNKPRRINLSFDPLDENMPTFWKSDLGRLEKIVRILKEADVAVKLTSAITTSNFKHFERHLICLTSLVRSYKNIETIAITGLYAIGRGLECKGLSLDQIWEILKKTEQSGLPLETRISLVNLPSLHEPLQSCPAGQSVFSIMPDAQITPCSMLYNLSRSFSVGNLLEDASDIIIERLDDFAEGVQKHIGNIKLLNKRCMKCKLVNDCGSGCFATMPVLSIDHLERIICKKQPKLLLDQQKQVFLSIEHPPQTGFPIPSTTGRKSPLDGQTEQKIMNYLRDKRPATDPAHSLEHIENTVLLARFISRKESANEKITVTAAYLHDLAPRNRSMHHFHTVRSARLAQILLGKIGGFSSEEINHIQQCIITSSYGSYLLGYKPRTIEAKVVRDADFLEAMGARGVGRAFAFGAYYGAKEMGKVEHSPRFPPVVFDMNLTGPDRSPIHHFFTKLLKLKDLILTDSGKQLAKRRHDFLVKFLEEYAFEESLESKALQASLGKFGSD